MEMKDFFLNMAIGAGLAVLGWTGFWLGYNVAGPYLIHRLTGL
jgi:hypothetical protein